MPQRPRRRPERATRLAASKGATAEKEKAELKNDDGPAKVVAKEAPKSSPAGKEAEELAKAQAEVTAAEVTKKDKGKKLAT